MHIARLRKRLTAVIGYDVIRTVRSVGLRLHTRLVAPSPIPVFRQAEAGGWVPE